MPYADPERRRECVRRSTRRWRGNLSEQDRWQQRQKDAARKRIRRRLWERRGKRKLLPSDYRLLSRVPPPGFVEDDLPHDHPVYHRLLALQGFTDPTPHTRIHSSERDTQEAQALPTQPSGVPPTSTGPPEWNSLDGSEAAGQPEEFVDPALLDDLVGRLAGLAGKRPPAHLRGDDWRRDPEQILGGGAGKGDARDERYRGVARELLRFGLTSEGFESPRHALASVLERVGVFDLSRNGRLGLLNRLDHRLGCAHALRTAISELDDLVRDERVVSVPACLAWRLEGHLRGARPGESPAPSQDPVLPPPTPPPVSAMQDPPSFEPPPPRKSTLTPAQREWRERFLRREHEIGELTREKDPHRRFLELRQKQRVERELT